MALRGRPTLATLGIILVVFGLQQVLALAGVVGLFVLAPPLSVQPWAAVTSVYAHASLAHLVGNAVALLIVGPFVARRSTPVRFHAFFVTTGAVAAVAEVVLSDLVGPPVGVLGASGAVFALLGYLLAGNVVSTVILDRIALSARTQAALLLVVAVGLTLATAGARSALFGHGTGLVCGLVAGRLHLVDR